MKQKNGKDHKVTRQWTDEDRVAKKALKENIKTAIIKGDFDEAENSSKLNEGEKK